MRQFREVQINIAPLVDVMLVLLIMFMANANALASHIQLELPQMGQTSSAPTQNITVSLSSNGNVYVDHKKVPLAHLGSYLRKISKPTDTIQFRADKRIHYGRIFEVINRLVDDGYTKISLVAEVRP